MPPRRRQPARRTPVRRRVNKEVVARRAALAAYKRALRR